MSAINTEHKVYMKVLTPVHVGGPQEKHLREGVDYLQYDNGETWRLNWKKIYRKFDPDVISRAVINRSMKSLLRNDLEALAVEMDHAHGSTGEIKACIRDGLGQAFIPGSSLKGALRSWLYTAFERISNRKGVPNLLGSFETDIFRFISPSDCYLDRDAQLFPTKTFNLTKQGSRWEGGWKHTAQIGTNDKFDNQSFVTDYECFSPNTRGSFSLKSRQPLRTSIKDQIFERSIEGRNSYELLYQNDSFLSLMHYVNEQVARHISLEMKFFSNYNQAESTHEIIQAYENLINESEKLKEGQCLLRLSGGSGFHGISGDHQFEDHVQTGIWTQEDAKRYKLSKKQSEQYVGRYIKMKSRKIAFTSNYMFPMGYVLLSNKPFITSVEKGIEDEKNVNSIVSGGKLDQLNASESYLKPRYSDAESLKMNDIVHGEIVDLGKPFHKIKLLLNNYPFESMVDLTGVKGYQFEIGAIVKCRLTTTSKTGEYKMAAYVP